MSVTPPLKCTVNLSYQIRLAEVGKSVSQNTTYMCLVECKRGEERNQKFEIKHTHTN